VQSQLVVVVVVVVVVVTRHVGATQLHPYEQHRNSKNTKKMTHVRRNHDVW
jgi:hypothetical protein